jgi:hypothetical protein
MSGAGHRGREAWLRRDRRGDENDQQSCCASSSLRTEQLAERPQQLETELSKLAKTFGERTGRNQKRPDEAPRPSTGILTTSLRSGQDADGGLCALS